MTKKTKLIVLSLIFAVAGAVATAVAYSHHEIIIEPSSMSQPYLVATVLWAKVSDGMVRTVTAYTASVDETDSEPEIMASGKRVYVGAIACPRDIPLKTKVEIGGKEYVCEDRMALKNDGKYDIFVGSKAEAYAFGRQELEVKILKKYESMGCNTYWRAKGYSCYEYYE